jgi:hypothetical protein
MNHEPPLKRGTKVDFDIGQGLAVGRGVVTDAEYDGGWLYRIDVAEGDPADNHRNERGELWVCDFEVRTSVEG